MANADQLLREAQELAANGNWAEGLRRCEEALLLLPEHVDAQYLRAVALKNLQRDGEAIAVLNVLLEQQPDFIAARYCRATLVYKAGEFAAAIGDLDVFLQANPRDDAGLLLRGLAAHYMGDNLTAVVFLSRAITIQPKNGAIYARRAKVLDALGLKREAAQDLATAKSLLAG